MIVEETREPVYGQEVKTAGLFVLLGGLITTALACWVVYLGNTGGNSTGLLGVYILFIVPISAIIAGFAAGAGYSILSWLTGVRVSSRLLVVVFVLTLLSYFAIQYCEYRKMQPRRAGSNETVSFPAYFDAITRSYSYHLDASISSRSETTNKRSKPVTGIVEMTDTSWPSSPSNTAAPRPSMIRSGIQGSNRAKRAVSADVRSVLSVNPSRGANASSATLSLSVVVGGVREGTVVVGDVGTVVVVSTVVEGVSGGGGSVDVVGGSDVVVVSVVSDGVQAAATSATARIERLSPARRIAKMTDPAGRNIGIFAQEAARP